MMRKLLPSLLLVGIMLLAFWKVVFHGEFTLVCGEDTAACYYPWFDVAAFWLKRGVLLLWDPYVYAGKFNMGEPQPGLFYPLNLLFMLLPAKGGGASIDGMQSLMILDYLLAAIFVYLLARSFEISHPGSVLAGVAFTLGGYTAQIYGYLNVLSGFVWMPLVFLLFRNSLLAGTRNRRLRNGLGGGLALGISFLAGHHVPTIHTGFLLLLYSVFASAAASKSAPVRSRLIPLSMLGLVAVVALLTTAFQWLPSAQWARNVYRWVGAANPVKFGEPVPYSVLQESSNLAPQDSISLLLPYVSVSASLYVGAVVLYLAIVGILFVRGREPAFLTLSLLIYYFLSWGRYSAIHGWFNTFVPGLWFAREVFYYLIPFQLCLALLAGLGLDRLVESVPRPARDGLRAFVRKSGWTMAVLVIASSALVSVLHMHRELPMDHPFITGLMSLSAYLSALGLLLFLLYSGRMRPAWFGIAATALVAVDLTSHFSKDIRPKSLPAGTRNTYVREFWKARPVVEFLREEQKKGRFRVDDPENVYPPNFGDAWRLDATMGHGATALVDYFSFRGTGWGPGSNASALLNAFYFLSRTELPGWTLVRRDREFLYRNPRAVPRAFLAARIRSFTSDSELLAWIGQPLFNPQDTVLLLKADLGVLPQDVRSRLSYVGEGLETRVLSRRTAADAAARGIQDAEARYRTLLFQAPWGWTGGDCLELLVSPSVALAESCVIFSYLPGSGNASGIELRLLGRGGEIRVPAELPGAPARPPDEHDLRRAVVRLGPLAREDYRLTIRIPEGCDARVDSLEVAAGTPPEEMDPAGSASIVSHEPNRIRLQAEARKPSLLVLSEVYHPGWEAWLDGSPAPLLKADHILRAVPVSPGRHTVELRFRPPTLLWGLAISGLALLAIVFALHRLR